MPSGKHKRSESHKGPGIVATEQLMLSLSEDVISWVKSQGKSVSSMIREVLEEEYGVFEVTSEHMSEAAMSGLRCLGCEHMNMFTDSNGASEAKCQFKGVKGRRISSANPRNGMSGADIIRRNLERSGAPSWCARYEEQNDD